MMLLPVLLLLISTQSLAGSGGVLSGEGGVRVYGPVPGLTPSPYYSHQVRRETSDTWLDTFTLHTECTAEKFCNTTGMFDNLNGWSNSYLNLEIEEGTEVEIKLTKLWGEPVTKAVVHPREAARSCEVRQGEVFVRINRPVLFTVDINGQMDDQDTGKLPNNRGYYDGPPIHTVTIFANPFVDEPSLEDPGVHTVSPGQEAPTEGPWHTLYFLPGLHDIGTSFRLHANKSYYIPGEAVVYGTMNNNKTWGDGHDIHVFGHGTISGDKLPHPSYAGIPDDQYGTYHPIDISGATNTRIEGVTIANSAFHSVMMPAGYKQEKPTVTRWVKIFTWRANGDGINPFSNGLVEDCFIRTQDDSTYVAGQGIRRVLYWQDCNGSTFVLSALGGDSTNSHPLVVEDCTVLYARAKWHHWSGGNLFNMRGEGGGSGGYTLTFRNIRVEDPRPTLQHFKILMQGTQPWSDPEKSKREPGDIYGITFQNIAIDAPSVLGEQEVLWGMEDGLIYGLVFDNVTIGGERVESVDYFYHNEYVLDDSN